MEMAKRKKDYQYNTNLVVGHNILSKDTKCLTELCRFKDWQKYTNHGNHAYGITAAASNADKNCAKYIQEVARHRSITSHLRYHRINPKMEQAYQNAVSGVATDGPQQSGTHLIATSSSSSSSSKHFNGREGDFFSFAKCLCDMEEEGELLRNKDKNACRTITEDQQEEVIAYLNTAPPAPDPYHFPQESGAPCQELVPHHRNKATPFPCQPTSIKRNLQEFVPNGTALHFSSFSSLHCQDFQGQCITCFPPDENVQALLKFVKRICELEVKQSKTKKRSSKNNEEKQNWRRKMLIIREMLR